MTSSLVGSEMCIRDSRTVVSSVLASQTQMENVHGQTSKAKKIQASPMICLLYTSDAADDM
eukprot:2054120-Prorocentrum_lima.AAC.1